MFILIIAIILQFDSDTGSKGSTFATYATSKGDFGSTSSRINEDSPFQPASARTHVCVYVRVNHLNGNGTQVKGFKGLNQKDKIFRFNKRTSSAKSEMCEVLQGKVLQGIGLLPFSHFRGPFPFQVNYTCMSFVMIMK